MACLQNVSVIPLKKSFITVKLLRCITIAVSFLRLNSYKVYEFIKSFLLKISLKFHYDDVVHQISIVICILSIFNTRKIV